MRSATGLLSLPFSLQTLMTASPSRARMEELASTRLIHSSAFACRATGETRVRKVRRGALQPNRWRIIWWLHARARGVIMHCFFLCEMKLNSDSSLCLHYYYSSIWHVTRSVVCLTVEIILIPINNPKCAVSLHSTSHSLISSHISDNVSVCHSTTAWISKTHTHFLKHQFAPQVPGNSFWRIFWNKEELQELNKSAVWAAMAHLDPQVGHALLII